MRKAIFLWWLSLFLLLFFWFPAAVSAQLYPDESEVGCEQGEKSCPPGSSAVANECNYQKPPDYTDAKGVTRPEFRPEAGLNLNKSVKGTSCGEVKSSPIVLEEKVSYPAPPWNDCTIHPAWGGEITMNYNFTSDASVNLRIPFAEEIADEWAGTLDTEQMKPEDYGDLIKRAEQNATTPKEMADKLAAQNEKNQREGVLRKLLTEDSQDKLKCNFANWVAKRHNRQLPTMYTYYAPDGKVFLPLLGGGACRNEVCPLTKPGDASYDRSKCLQNYDDGTTTVAGPYGPYAPGPAWQKMPLIPNERTRGQIKFFVCGDKRYNIAPDYPEVMRLGLSANELFKIFTDKASQDRFYQQYPDLKDNPLANLLAPATPKPGVPQSSTITPPDVILGTPTAVGIPIHIGARMTSILAVKASNFLKIFIPKVQTALAKTVENIKTNKTSLKLAQAPVKQITVTPQTKLDNGQLQYSATITAPVDGHIFTEIWIDGQKAGGTVNAVRAGQTLVYGTPGMAPSGADIYKPLSGDHKIEFKVKCDDCNIPGQQGQEIWAGCTVVSGVCTPISYPVSTGGTNLAGKCDATKSCCTTADCGPATPPPKSQTGPSHTTVWPQAYPASHVLLGVDWATKDSSSEDFNDPVVYSFKPTLSDCTFTPNKDEDGLYTSCGDDSSCGGLSCHEGKCGSWSCGRTHDRVINVYNSVPFLASVWQQAADPVWGFMSAIKPLGITGSGNIPSDYQGCTDDQNMMIDQFGNYVPEHGSEPIYYGFNQMYMQPNNAEKIEVSIKPESINGKILYYRLAGTCNANKWWTEKVLNPMLNAGLNSSGLNNK